MKLCVIGAGAMGCLIGGMVQKGGHEVSFIARGRQLDALRARGLTLVSSDHHTWSDKVAVAEKPEALGKHDVILLTTKAYQLPDVAPMLAPLMHDDTVIVPAVNGLPWWYFHKHGGEFDGRALQSLDPAGVLAEHVPLDRVVGCVNYLAGTLVKPGEVQYLNWLEGRVTIGELDGATTPRLQALEKMLGDGGFAPVVNEPIRTAIWHKLWGNIAFNPIGALTGGTIDQIAEGYHDIDLVSAVMNEARMIADRLGIELNQTIKARVQLAAKVRGHRTSMLMDIEQGRPTEIEAIVGSVREIAGWFQVGTPFLNALYSLVKIKEIYYRPAGQR